MDDKKESGTEFILRKMEEEANAMSEPKDARGLQPNFIMMSPENIRAWDHALCKHENVQEILLLNFSVKQCKDCGKEVK